MHILYLHQYFVPPDGAGGIRSYELASRLVKMGHEVTIVTSASRLPEKYLQGNSGSFQIDGIKIVPLSVQYSNQMGYLRRIIAFFMFAFLASIETLRHRTDIIYATSTPLTIIIPAAIAKFFKRRPLVFEVRDLWPEMPIAMGVLKNPIIMAPAKFLEWLAYRYANHIVALSPSMTDTIVAGGIAPDKVSTITNSCNTELFGNIVNDGLSIRQKLNLFDDQPLVTYTGTFGKLNGVSFLIDLAVECMKQELNITFLLVGGGAEYDLAISKAEFDCVINKNLFIWERVPKPEIPNILDASTLCTSVFLPIPEMWKNSANKFFDGLAAGKPIAINYYGWQAEVLEEHNAGFVLNPHDIQDAVETLKRHIYDREWLTNAGKSARWLAENKFNFDQAAQDVERIVTANFN